MNNNDYVNLLTTIAHEKGKDRKLLLKMEIAKATDPIVKEQLQLLLEEQESQERRNKLIAGIFFAVLFVALILGFMKWIFYPNNEIKTSAASSSTTVSTVANTNDDTQLSSSLSDSSTSEQDPRTETVQSQISNSQNYTTTNLSETEAIDWAKIYLYESGKISADVINASQFETSLKEDGLLYIYARTNNLHAILRIDSEGNLQETTDFAYMSDWKIVRNSEDYLEDSKKEVSNHRSDYSIKNNNHDQANAVRELMAANQGFDPDVLASIPDEEILAANVGNATNSAIAQTAKNLLDKYPNLKN